MSRKHLHVWCRSKYFTPVLLKHAYKSPHRTQVKVQTSDSGSPRVRIEILHFSPPSRKSLCCRSAYHPLGSKISQGRNHKISHWWMRRPRGSEGFGWRSDSWWMGEPGFKPTRSVLRAGAQLDAGSHRLPSSARLASAGPAPRPVPRGSNRNAIQLWVQAQWSPPFLMPALGDSDLLVDNISGNFFGQIMWQLGTW